MSSCADVGPGYVKSDMNKMDTLLNLARDAGLDVMVLVEPWHRQVFPSLLCPCLVITLGEVTPIAW